MAEHDSDRIASENQGLTEVMQTYHSLSGSNGRNFSEEELEKMEKCLLKELYNSATPLNIRVKLVELCGEKVCLYFGSSLGSFLQCFLFVLNEAMVNLLKLGIEETNQSKQVLLLEASLRALVSVCLASPAETQPHMVRELSDIFLQVAHICQAYSPRKEKLVDSSHLSRISAAASKALQRIPNLNFESVLIKVIHWINFSSRYEEKDSEIKHAEALFASKMLTKIIKDQLLHVSLDNNADRMTIIKENMLNFFVRTINATNYLKSPRAVQTIWTNGIRRAGLLDDNSSVQLIVASMNRIAAVMERKDSDKESESEVILANASLFEIIIAEAPLARKFCADAVVPYLNILLQEQAVCFHNQKTRFIDITRLSTVLTILLGDSGKYESHDFQNLFIKGHSFIIDELNGYIEDSARVSGTSINLFHIESILGAFIALFNGCPLVQKSFYGPESDPSRLGITSERADTLRKSLHVIKEYLDSPLVKEAMYCSKRKSKECHKEGSGSQKDKKIQFAKACDLVHQMVSGLLESPAQLPKSFRLSWENCSLKQRRSFKESQEQKTSKRSKIWIPTGIKESLKRHVLH